MPTRSAGLSKLDRANSSVSVDKLAPSRPPLGEKMRIALKPIAQAFRLVAS